MSSPVPSQVTPRRLTFDWIEHIAVPIAASVMEAQPIALSLLFFSLLSLGENYAPVDIGDTILLLLGLHWWALLVRVFTRDVAGKLMLVLKVTGLMIALLISFLRAPWMFDLPVSLVGCIAVVIWAWKRGMDKAGANFRDEYFILTFKYGFIVLLIITAFSIVAIGDLLAPVLRLLPYSLPLFFFSGLIALSYNRLNAIRREQRRLGGVQIDPTRNWVIVLTCCWIVIVLTTLALELFSFELIQALMIPVWHLLGLIVGAILYGIAYVVFAILYAITSLFSLLLAPFRREASQNERPVPPPPPQSPANRPPQLTIAPEWILIGQYVLIALVVITVLVIVVAILRKRHVVRGDFLEEETRESLIFNGLLSGRNKSQTSKSPLDESDELLDEALPEYSARAYYRELLQSVARVDNQLGRKEAETPVEYQVRLQQQASGTSRPRMNASDDTLLSELTQAYIQERYGGKKSELSPITNWSSWITRFVDRLIKWR